MNKAWVAKGLIVALLLAMVAVAGAVPKHVQAQTEASMLLTGKISIHADGSVSGYEIDHEDQVPAHVLSNLAQWVPAWRFKPVVVEGKAVPARARMTLRMLAMPMGDGKFNISIASTNFGNDDALPTDEIRSLRMQPPAYPEDIFRAGGQGIAYLLLKIGREGTVDDVVVERVNLGAYASERRMANFRKRMSAVAVAAAKRWTFVPPTTGTLAQQPWWAVRVPVDFNLGEEREVVYGQWVAYLPGPYQRPPWLSGDDSGSDALAGGAIYTVGSGLVLLTPLRG